MKIVISEKTGNWDSCICCAGTRTYPDERKKRYPIRDVHIKYFGGKNGTSLTLCSACATDIANQINNIDFSEEADKAVSE